MTTTRRALLSAVAIVASSPLAAWSTAGALLGTSSLAGGVAGVLAGLVGIGAAVELWQLRQEGNVARGWMTTPVLLCGAGALAGVGWRSLTALGAGQTIGGGVFILPGLPVAVGLLVAAGVNARRERRR